ATTIGASAFKGCVELTTATMPVCTKIENNAFANCAKLTTAVVKNGCDIGQVAFTGVASGLKLYVLTEVDGKMQLKGDGNTEALKALEIQATRESANSTIYRTVDGTTFDTTTNQLTPPSTGGGGGYFPPTPTTDPTAPIQPKEQTITNADGTKTTVILFDGTKSGTPAKGEALLSAEALAKIAAVKDAGAVVATSTAIVQFDQKALQAITGGQTKGNIKVIAEIVSKDTLTPEQKALLGDNALIIDLSVENENGKVTDFNGGTATVVIKIPAGVDPTTLGAVYIKTNGKLEKVEGK
ncbi:MAG: leucine-rich repeat protein, partial [Enterococcus sp.]